MYLLSLIESNSRIESACISPTVRLQVGDLRHCPYQNKTTLAELGCKQLVAMSLEERGLSLTRVMLVKL